MELIQRLTRRNVKEKIPLESPEQQTLSKEFIPVRKFRLRHLPKSYKDKLIVSLIKAASSLTVLTVAEPARRQQQTGHRYSLTYQTGPDQKQCTGFIDDVVWLRNQSPEKCACVSCAEVSEVFKAPVASINMLTARRVIHDKFSEGIEVTCRLSFYKKNSQTEKLGNFTVEREDIDRDLLLMKSLTCDDKLARRLDKYVGKFNRLWREVHKKYRDLDIQQKLVIIVSHPLGQAQHVSVGYLKETETDHDGMKSRLKYTTPVAAGSEGAHVLVIGG
ncbi:hypothetical protein Btru_043276 [Bulinus truncatus]|nr:hypothetical protein Btru_043276 [Bulinus truncatus]